MPRSMVAQVFAEEWPKLVAILTRELGDLDLAEDASQEAFAEAARCWGPNSTPDRPGAWLVTTARRKAIDQLRRRKRYDQRLAELDRLAHNSGKTCAPTPDSGADYLVDDRLSLILGCCHRSLSTEAQVALTLRAVGGLSTAQIAAAFLIPEATMAKRIVRAKKKIRAANIPFSIPTPDQLVDRIEAVLSVIYVIFTAGHTSSEQGALVRGDLCDEARWLAALVDRLLTDREHHHTRPGSRWPARYTGDQIAIHAEVKGLSALMLLTDARRTARVDAAGALVLLEDQDRTKWDSRLLSEGLDQLSDALSLGHVGAYQMQAAIAGVHATARSWEETQWPQIVSLYDQLAIIDPSPVVLLNRAVAVSMLDGPEAALESIDQLARHHDFRSYRYFHAARAYMLRRMGRCHDAINAYKQALALGGNDSEIDFLRSQMNKLAR